MVDFVKGVVRLERVLKYWLNFTPEIATFAAGKTCEVFATIEHFACVWYMTAQKKSSQSGLTTTTFAGYCGDGRFVLINRQRNVVNCNCYGATTEHPFASEGLGDMI